MTDSACKAFPRACGVPWGSSHLGILVQYAPTFVPIPALLQTEEYWYSTVERRIAVWLSH